MSVFGLANHTVMKNIPKVLVVPHIYLKVITCYLISRCAEPDQILTDQVSVFSRT